MNEFEFLKSHLKTTAADSIIKSVGDDCSVTKYDDHFYRIQSTDCLVEDVHFRLSTMSFAEIAYRSLAVNISDISAMGGFPQEVHLSVAVPNKVQESQLSEFFHSFQKACEENQIHLLGGDLSKSETSLFINVHISGLVKKENILFRQGLSKDSVLCVTGPLGNSAAGLYCLENKNEGFNSLKQFHKHPPILTDLALFIGGSHKVLGMMDLSDGLLSDLNHIKNTEIKIHLEQIPLSKELVELVHQENKDPYQWALGGGEDYELLFNCLDSDFDYLRDSIKEKFNKEIYKIGELKSGENKRVFMKDNKPVKMDWPSFKHF